MIRVILLDWNRYNWSWYVSLENQKAIFKTKEGRKCLVFYDTFWKFFHLQYLNLIRSLFLNWCVQGLSCRSLLKNRITYRGSAALERMVLPLQVSWCSNTEGMKARRQNRTSLVFSLRICWFHVTHSDLDSAEMRAGVGPWCAARLLRLSGRTVSRLPSGASISEHCRSCDPLTSSCSCFNNYTRERVLPLSLNAPD